MNKRVFSLLTIICCLTLVLGIFVSCNQKTENQDVSFTVLFSVDGEIYAEVTTSDNATISMPANPVKDGYVFDGWYWDDGTWLEPFTVESLANRPLQDQGVLYAKWITEQEALIGTVTLVTNGGSQLSPIRSEVIDTSPVSTREGYMLEGWYTDITLSNKATFPFAVEGDMVLYAKWTAIEYTIDYMLVGGQFDGTVPYGYTIENSVRLPSPTKVGHTFDGWYASPDHTGQKITSISVGQTGNRTYYAKWRINSYTLNFESNGGTNINPIVKEFGEALVEPTAPTRPGYEFVGWYSNSECTEPFAFDTMPASDIWVFAKWEVISYRIEYELDGGVFEGEYLNEYICENAYTLPIPKKDSYTFAGWYDNEDFSGEKVEEITAGSFGNRKLWAKWQVNSYTIEFDTDGGSYVESITQDYGSAVQQPAAPKKNGYDFAGWYSDETLLQKYHFTTIPAENIVVYAKWEVIDYAIEFDTDGAALPEDAVSSYTVEDAVSLPYLAKEGHTFHGWYDNAEFEGEAITQIAVGTVGDKQFYAKFTINQYTIKFDVDGGSDVDPITQEYATKLEKPQDPVKAGYEFLGWYVDEQFDEEFLFGTMPSKDITVYAGWRMIVYSIAYITDEVSLPEDAAFTYTIEDEVILPALSKEGHTFVGWFIDEDCAGDPVGKIEKGTMGDKRFYAKWVPYLIEKDKEGNVTITSYTGTDAYADIPSAINGCPVTGVGESAFSGNMAVVSVTIPDSVTSIGYSAFSGCSGLKSITIPFVGAEAGKTSSDTYQYPFGYIFGTTSYTGGTGVKQYYYGSSAPSTTNSTYYIPSSLREVTVTGGNILYGAFYNCTGLTSITIPDGVASIGDEAFRGCTGLTSITIPDSVTRIEWAAFDGCSGLMSITIPDGVTSIGSYAFRDCTGLTSVTIGNSVTSIGDDAFYNTGLTSIYYTGDIAGWCGISGLGNIMLSGRTLYIDGSKVADAVTIPDGVTSIRDRAFAYCTGLTSVTIGDGVTSIGYRAFYGCTGLTSITIPDSVTSIGYRAFYGCTGLTSITIPDSVTSIGDDAFAYCSGLTSVTIPDSVTSIGSYAFYNCSGLTSITIPDSVKSIRDYAFYGCSGLPSVTIPDSVKSIGDYAFYDCTGLPSITIPDSVTSIGYGAFSGCRGLESITIPFVGAEAGKTSSDTYQYPFGYIFGTTFYTGGTGVTQYYYGSSTSSTTYNTYYIPSSLREVTVTGGNILRGAFYNCLGLTSVTIGDGVTSIGNYAFYNCSGLTSVTIGAGVTSIGYEAFYGCTGLTSITIPDSVTSVGYRAFYGCSGLTSVTIGEGVTSIGSAAFYGCTGLTSITIPDSVTSIGSSAFYGCTGLTEINWNAVSVEDFNSGNNVFANAGTAGAGIAVTFGESVEEIPAYLFYLSDSSYRPNIKSVTIGSNVTSIGDYAFYNCSGLTSITIPDSVKSIGDYAFYGCSGLTSVTIGDSVTSIGYSAFSGCSGLTSVTIGDSVTSIGYSAFSGCSGLTSVTIGEGVTSIGSSAFSGCSGLKSITIPFVGAEAGKTSSDTYQYPFGYIFGTTSYTGGTGVKQYYYSSSTWITTNRTYYIPSSLREVTVKGGNILYGAFYNCSGLTSVTIGDSVTSIGYSAFSGCSGLTSVTITA